MLQLNPPLPLVTPRGKGMAVLVNDPGTEHHLEWTVLLDNGEVWTFQNPEVRARENETVGRMPREKGAPSSETAGLMGEILQQRLAECRQDRALLCEGVDLAWGIIANVSGGDLTQQSATWQDAAREFHDHAAMSIAATHAMLTARESRSFRMPSPPDEPPAREVRETVPTQPNRLTDFIAEIEIQQAPLHILVTRMAQEGRLEIRVWRDERGGYQCAALCEVPTAGGKTLTGQNHPAHSDSGGTAMKSALLELLCGEQGRDAAPWFRRPSPSLDGVTVGAIFSGAIPRDDHGSVTSRPGDRLNTSLGLGPRIESGEPNRWLLDDDPLRPVKTCDGAVVVDIAGWEVHVRRAWLERARQALMVSPE